MARRLPRFRQPGFSSASRPCLQADFRGFCGETSHQTSVQPEALQGLERQCQMGLVGRVEGAAQQTDGLARLGQAAAQAGRQSRPATGL